MIELRNISKIYDIGDVKVTALNDVSFTCDKDGFIYIIGYSGSGKSTMMNFLDRPSSVYLRDGSIIEEKKR
jgi:putative ABC transport system ATP-binding protein